MVQLSSFFLFLKQCRLLIFCYPPTWVTVNAIRFCNPQAQILAFQLLILKSLPVIEITYFIFINQIYTLFCFHFSFYYMLGDIESFNNLIFSWMDILKVKWIIIGLFCWFWIVWSIILAAQLFRFHNCTGEWFLDKLFWIALVWRWTSVCHDSQGK